MAEKPTLPQFTGDVRSWAQRLVSQLEPFHARIQAEQTEAPFIPGFLLANLPDPAKYAGTGNGPFSRIIFVPDAAEGPALLYSDGTAWLTLVQDGQLDGYVQSVTAGDGSVAVDNTDPQNPVATAPFSPIGRLLLLRTTAQSIPDSTVTPIVWDAVEYDTHSAWSGSASITVPAGVTHYRAVAQCSISSAAVTDMLIEVVKTPPGVARGRTRGATGGTPGIQVSTPVVPCAPLDVLTVNTYQVSGSSQNTINGRLVWVGVEWFA